ncbi:DNA-directed RNA polymerase II subunit RPB11 isoform X1, partial [Aphis craccivora]
RQSPRKKVKPVYYNDHNKVFNWLNSIQNEFQSNLYLNNISDTGYNNDEDILDKTYNINIDFYSNLGLESEIHINNDHEMYNETTYTELIPPVFNLGKDVISGSRLEGLVWTPNWQNFYWAPVGFCHARGGGWRSLSPDTVTCPKRGAARDRGSNRLRCASQLTPHQTARPLRPHL